MYFFSEDKFNQVCHYKWVLDEAKRKADDASKQLAEATKEIADAQKAFDNAAREFVETWLKYDGVQYGLPIRSNENPSAIQVAL